MLKIFTCELFNYTMMPLIMNDFDMKAESDSLARK